jgi:hypothetical protein
LCQLATFHTRSLIDGTTGTQQLLSYPILTYSRWASPAHFLQASSQTTELIIYWKHSEKAQSS